MALCSIRTASAIFRAMRRLDLEAAEKPAATATVEIHVDCSTFQDRATCPGLSLWDLPAELRNTIYALSFTTDNTDTGERDYINLLYADPPSKSLLLVCRQAYNEARGLYRTAYQLYWSKNSFIMHIMVPPPKYKKGRHSPSPLKLQELESITSLSIIGWHPPFNIEGMQQIVTKDALRIHKPRVCWSLRNDRDWDVVMHTPHCTINCTVRFGKSWRGLNIKFTSSSGQMCRRLRGWWNGVFCWSWKSKRISMKSQVDFMVGFK